MKLKPLILLFIFLSGLIPSRASTEREMVIDRTQAESCHTLQKVDNQSETAAALDDCGDDCSKENSKTKNCCDDDCDCTCCLHFSNLGLKLIPAQKSEAICPTEAGYRVKTNFYYEMMVGQPHLRGILQPPRRI